MHRRQAIAAIFTLSAEICYAGNEGRGKKSDHWISALPNFSIDDLNARANDLNGDDSDRALAVFSLFAHYISPGCSAKKIHSVLGNSDWLKESALQRVDEFAGLIPVEFVPGSVFCVTLFVDRNRDAGKHYFMYLRFSRKLEVSEARSLLNGTDQASNVLLIEYALCFPDGCFGRFSGDGAQFACQA